MSLHSNIPEDRVSKNDEVSSLDTKTLIEFYYEFIDIRIRKKIHPKEADDNRVINSNIVMDTLWELEKILLNIIDEYEYDHGFKFMSETLNGIDIKTKEYCELLYDARLKDVLVGEEIIFDTDREFPSLEQINLLNDSTLVDEIKNKLMIYMYKENPSKESALLQIKTAILEKIKELYGRNKEYYSFFNSRTELLYSLLLEDKDPYAILKHLVSSINKFKNDKLVSKCLIGINLNEEMNLTNCVVWYIQEMCVMYLLLNIYVNCVSYLYSSQCKRCLVKYYIVNPIDRTDAYFVREGIINKSKHSTTISFLNTDLIGFDGTRYYIGSEGALTNIGCTFTDNINDCNVSCSELGVIKESGGILLKDFSIIKDTANLYTYNPIVNFSLALEQALENDKFYEDVFLSELKIKIYQSISEISTEVEKPDIVIEDIIVENENIVHIGDGLKRSFMLNVNYEYKFILPEFLFDKLIQSLLEPLYNKEAKIKNKLSKTKCELNILYDIDIYKQVFNIFDNKISKILENIYESVKCLIELILGFKEKELIDKCKCIRKMFTELNTTLQKIYTEYLLLIIEDEYMNDICDFYHNLVMKLITIEKDIDKLFNNQKDVLIISNEYIKFFLGMSEQNSSFHINKLLLNSSIPVKIAEFYIFLREAMCCDKATYNFIEDIIIDTENLRILKDWLKFEFESPTLKLEILGKSKTKQRSLHKPHVHNIGKTDYVQLCSHIKRALMKINDRYKNLNTLFEHREINKKYIISLTDKINKLRELTFCKKDIYYLLDNINIQDYINEMYELELDVNNYSLVKTSFEFDCFESWNMNYTFTVEELTIFANLLLNFTELKDIYIFLNSDKFNSKIHDSLLIRKTFLDKVNKIKSVEKVEKLISKYNNIILRYKHDFKIEVKNAKIAKKLRDEESICLKQAENDKKEKKKAKKKERKNERRQKYREEEAEAEAQVIVPKTIKKEVSDKTIYDFISEELKLSSNKSGHPALEKTVYKITEQFVTNVRNNDIFRYLLSLMTFFGSKVLLDGNYVLDDIDSNLHSFLIENKETEHIIDLQSRENIELISPITMLYELSETSFGNVLVNKFDIILSIINKNEYYSNGKSTLFDMLLYLYKVVILVKKIFSSENLKELDTVKYISEYDLILKRIVIDCNKIKFNNIRLSNKQIENIKNIVTLALECRKAQLFVQKNAIQPPAKKVKRKVTNKPRRNSLQFKEPKTKTSCTVVKSVDITKEIIEEAAIKEAEKRALLSSMREKYEETNNELKESIENLCKVINLTVLVLFINGIRGINTEISVLYKHDKLYAKEIKILKSDLLCLDLKFDEIEDYSSINVKDIIKVIDIDTIELFKTSLKDIGRNIVSSLPRVTRKPITVCDRSTYFGINIENKTMKKSEIKVLDVKDTYNNNILKLGKIDLHLFLLEGGTSKDYYFSTNLELFTVYLIKENPFGLIPIIGENIDESCESIQDIPSDMIKIVTQMITKTKTKVNTFMRGRSFLTNQESEPLNRRPKLFGKRIPVPPSRPRGESVDADNFMMRVTELNLEFSKISDSRKKYGTICNIDKLIDDIQKIIISSPSNILEAFETFITMVLEAEELNMKFKFLFKNICKKIKSTELHRIKNINRFITEIKKVLSKVCYYSNYEQTLNKF